MKRLWGSALILILLFSVSIYHTVHLSHFVEQLNELLVQSERMAEQEQWDVAARMVEQVSEQWEAQANYLHTTLQHADIDEIVLTLRELQEYIEHQELDQCAAITANLVAQLDLLAEMEQFSLRNIF